MNWDMILFDLDGTITNSEEGITKSVRYALEGFGIREENQALLRRFIGPPLQDSFAEHYGMSEADAWAALLRYRERYEITGIFECEIYEGVEAAFRRLKAAGYYIGLASSKPEEACRRILEHFGLLSYFDEVVGATQDKRISSKVQVLREWLRRSGADPGRAVLVGDTRFDALGAAEAGIACIGVTYGFGTREELEQGGAIAVFDSMKEVADYIEGQ